MFFAIKKKRKDFITLSNLCKTIRSILLYFYIALNYSYLICSNLFNFASATFCFMKFLGTLSKQLDTKFKTNPPLVCTQQNFLLLMLEKFSVCYIFMLIQSAFLLFSVLIYF